MAFTRPPLLGQHRDAETLTGDMVDIGMNFAAPANPDAKIEETLVHASALGMDDHDLRVLSVLTTWFGVHDDDLNADRRSRPLRPRNRRAASPPHPGHSVLPVQQTP